MASPAPFPFVVGCGRSGTTLLAAMLDSHPCLAVPAESGGFVLEICGLPVRSASARRTRRAARRPPPPLPEGPAGLSEALGALESWDRYRRWGLDRAEVLEALQASPPSSRPELVRAVYRAYARAQGKPRYADKTPNHVLHMDALAALFPEAVFAHVLRDGRSVALALMDASFGPGDAASAASWWRRRVAAGRASGARLGPRRYREVSYEALVSDPEEALRGLCAFLGLDWDPAMLRFEEASARQIAMSPRPEEDRSLARPLTPGLRDWRAAMPEEDLWVFEALAGRCLRSCGYPLARPGLPPGSRARCLGRALAEASRRAARRLARAEPPW